MLDGISGFDDSVTWGSTTINRELEADLEWLLVDWGIVPQVFGGGNGVVEKGTVKLRVEPIGKG